MATVKAIKYGMKGDDVSNLQTALKNAGYNVDVDGSFGSQTLEAVKQYQQANGLDADGMVGPQTQAKLFGNTSTSTNTSAGTNTGGAGSAASAATINYPTQPTYDQYVAPERVVGDNVNKARAALDAVLAAQPGAYQSKWQAQLDDIIGRILNREAFSYDFNEDALYKQYAEQYMRGGKLAMQDTMGQAAAMTGGYGNSYASTAGNQAYQEYLSQLNAVIPELYGMALDRYQMEGQEMYNQYGLLSDQEAQDYGRYQDSYNKWLAERDYATGVYNTEEDRDYSRYWNDVQLGYQTHNDKEMQEWNEYVTAVQNTQWDKSFAADEEQRGIDNKYRDESMAYAKQQDAILRIDEMIKNGVMPSDEDIAAAGLTPDYVQKMYNAYEDQRTEVTSEKIKAEAMDKIKTYWAAGMEIPKQLQKQAGLSDDDLKALTGSYTASSTTTTKAVTPDVIDKWYSAISDFETEDEVTEYLTKSGLEDENPTLSDYLLDLWLKAHGLGGGTTVDTTVAKGQPKYTGGGGGKIMVRY